MKAQDIEFVKAEAMSIKTDGYAKRSELPRKTASAIIVQKLSETVDTEKPRSNYVNVLMEIGISRRSAYRLVGEAYKAKAVTSDNAAKVPKAPAIQTMAADVRSDGADHPAATPAPRYIQWPDDVKKAADSVILHPLEDIVTGAWRVGVMRSENQIEKADYQPILQQIKDNLTKHMGKFSDAVLRKAFSSGVNGKEPPLNELASIPETPSMNNTGLVGKKASVFVSVKGSGNPSLKDPFCSLKEEQEWRDRINAMTCEGDECAAFLPSGTRETDKNGEVMRFDNLIQAIEFTKATGEIAIVIHQL